MDDPNDNSPLQTSVKREFLILLLESMMLIMMVTLLVI